MWKRLKNLWAWSAISPSKPFEVQDQGFRWTGWVKPTAQKGEIVYIDKVKEVLKDNPEATLDELITR